MCNSQSKVVLPLSRLLVSPVITLCSLLLVTSVANAQLGLVGSEIFEFISIGARYGSAVAIGDLNGDGNGDLIVGQPSLDFGGDANRGAIRLYVSNPSGGLTFNSISNCLDGSENGGGYRFGASLAFGNFNDDQYADLAVGMPGGSAGAVPGAGAVCVIYGSETPPYSRARFSQSALQGTPETGDEFGAALATGDLNDDGIDELAVGAPGEGVAFGGGTVDGAGAFHIILGSPTGLTTIDNLIFHQGQAGVPVDPEENDRFGASLAIAHFFGLGGSMDVAVGAPGDQASPGGTVTVFSSGAAPASVAHFPYYPQNPTWDLLGTAAIGDEFGQALAAGDFDGDGRTDLAIGIPGDDDFGTEIEPGAVMVMYNGPGNNLTDAGEQLFYEAVIDGSSAGVNNFDGFGKSLAAGDFNKDGFADLAIGAPSDNSLGVNNAGEVTVLYGSPTGLSVTGFQLIDMIFFDTLEAGDEFGFALAAGRLYEAQGGDDLAIGVPGRTHVTGGGALWPDTGRVVVVQSTILFKDGFETGDVTVWEPK